MLAPMFTPAHAALGRKRLIWLVPGRCITSATEAQKQSEWYSQAIIRVLALWLFVNVFETNIHPQGNLHNRETLLQPVEVRLTRHPPIVFGRESEDWT